MNAIPDYILARFAIAKRRADELQESVRQVQRVYGRGYHLDCHRKEHAEKRSMAASSIRLFRNAARKNGVNANPFLRFVPGGKN
jgi:hypothetical protein